ncbi:hypothetical protein ACTSEZ_01915 [Metabacillus sp. JX24]|uniref:hypothetical protein n=1 Tax=Metabacillus sp. JX24 TaxID=3240759 RepID=UPI00350F32AF
MKSYDEFDLNLKSLDKKIQLDEKNKNEIFHRLSNMIAEDARPKRTIQWKYYLSLTAASLLLVLLFLPSVLNNETAEAPSAEKSYPDETRELKAADIETDFKLTETEYIAYAKLKEDLNEAHIKGLMPVSIAKIYVQASLDEELEVVYELYTDRAGEANIPKDEFLAIENRETKEQLLELFEGIQNGTFIKEDGLTGHITYTRISGETGHFSMIMDEDGIWNVSFMPIQ